MSCLVHIRRKFIKAQDEHPRIVAWVFYQIAQLYQLETKLKKRRASPALRLRARRRWSQRRYQHLGRLFKHLHIHRSILPKSPLGEALHYALGQWPHLAPCFEDGRIELDNNLVENAIRPTKLGHKNWMFVGGKDTGWRSAVIYTFVEQVRIHGADPFRYFEWVFEKLMHHPEPGGEEIDALLPTTWIKQQRDAADKIA